MYDVKLGGGLQLVKTHIELNIKRLVPEAILPKYSKNGDAGLDLTAISMNETDMYIEYGTGLAFEIPYGHVGLIYPRSSLSNYDLILTNHVGVVDSGYRGEVKFRFKKTSPGGDFDSSNDTITLRIPNIYKVGDRIGQLIVMPYPLVVINEVSELEETTRGAGGFGSSGK